MKLKRLQHKRFPVNFAKYLRTFILQNTSTRLLLVNIDSLNKKRFIKNIMVKMIRA